MFLPVRFSYCFINASYSYNYYVIIINCVLAVAHIRKANSAINFMIVNNLLLICNLLSYIVAAFSTYLALKDNRSSYTR